MALPYLPHQGEILVCDFDDFAMGAEMVKRRPIVVASRHDTHRGKMCTVIPLSTTPPDPVKSWHHQMPHLKIAGWQANGVIWAKCDMLASVSIERLNKPYIRTRHGRSFVTHKLDAQDMAAVMQCIRAYFGI